MEERRIPDEKSRVEAAQKAFDRVVSYLGAPLFRRMLADAEEDVRQGAGGSQFRVDAQQLGVDNPAMTLAIRPGEGINFTVGDDNVHYLEMGRALTIFMPPSSESK